VLRRNISEEDLPSSGRSWVLSPKCIHNRIYTCACLFLFFVIIIRYVFLSGFLVKIGSCALGRYIICTCVEILRFPHIIYPIDRWLELLEHAHLYLYPVCVFLAHHPIRR
jgi:hypothetical protein